MSFLDNLETTVLFRFARLLTLLLVLAGAVMTVFGIILYDPLSLGQSSYVTAAEIRSELTANPQVLAPAQPRYDAGGIAVSAELDRFILLFDPNEYDRAQLRAEASSWVQQIEDPDDRVQFLRNMSEVVGEFPPRERGSAAYAFVRLRYKKEAQRALAVQESAASRGEGKLLFLYGIGIVGMFSLVLVMLRIERNTRRQ
ncbi:MAG: hypothetical protein ABSD64_07965 [Terriglobales bacterium]|jgi:hypothetical protein